MRTKNLLKASASAVALMLLVGCASDPEPKTYSAPERHELNKLIAHTNYPAKPHAPTHPASHAGQKAPRKQVVAAKAPAKPAIKVVTATAKPSQSWAQMFASMWKSK